MDSMDLISMPFDRMVGLIKATKWLENRKTDNEYIEKIAETKDQRNNNNGNKIKYVEYFNPNVSVKKRYKAIDKIRITNLSLSVHIIVNMKFWNFFFSLFIWK